MQNLLDATVEALSHTVGSGRFWWGQAVIYLEDCVEYVELMRANRRIKEPVVELRVVVSENVADAQRSAPKAVKHRGVSIALACRAFGVSETCYRYSPLLGDENEVIADLLVGLTEARKT